MPDVTPLLTAVDRLATRLRTLPQSTLQRGTAARGLALARELSRRAQRLEAPGREPLEMPDAGLFAVGDQLAVAGHDLAEALRSSGTEAESAESLRRVTAAAEDLPVTGARPRAPDTGRTEPPALAGRPSSRHINYLPPRAR
jgi:hypothetical protein